MQPCLACTPASHLSVVVTGHLRPVATPLGRGAVLELGVKCAFVHDTACPYIRIELLPRLSIHSGLLICVSAAVNELACGIIASVEGALFHTPLFHLVYGGT